MGTLEDFRDTQISSKSNRFSNRIWPKADSTIASGHTLPYLARISFSSEPPFTPMRIGMFLWRQASGHRLYTVLTPDISGIDPDLVGAGRNGFQRQPIIKVDIHHHRQRTALLDFSYRMGRRLSGTATRTISHPR